MGGDRAYRGKPQELEENIKKLKKKREREPGPDQEHRKDIKKRRIQEETVLRANSSLRGKRPELEDNIKKSKTKKERGPEPDQEHRNYSLLLSLVDEGVYQPKSKETRAAYEALLSVIQQQFGGQPQDVLTGAADEVLAVLKNDKIKNPDKKKDIERLLNAISSQFFDQLVSIARLITDYQDGGEAAGTAAAAAANGNDGGLEDDIGVAVEFEEDEEEESDYDQVQEESEDDDDGQEPNDTGAIHMEE